MKNLDKQKYVFAITPDITLMHILKTPKEAHPHTPLQAINSHAEYEGVLEKMTKVRSIKHGLYKDNHPVEQKKQGKKQHERNEKKTQM